MIIKLLMNNHKINQRGFTLVELVISLAIFVIVTGGIATLAIGSHMSFFEDSKRLQAEMRLTETWEALRAIRHHDWAAVTNGPHGLRYTGGAWEFFGTSDSLDGVTRQVTVADIQRDDSGNIVSSGGTVDSDSKSIHIVITWAPYAEGPSQSVTLDTYLHNYYSPEVWPNP